MPSGESSPPWTLSLAQSLAFLALPLTHFAAPPKSFFAPLTAPMTTKSTALLIGAWTFWMIDWIFSEMPPRPSRLARKEIASGSALARVSSTFCATIPMVPLAIAPIESRIERTKAMISLPRSMMNMMMS